MQTNRLVPGFAGTLVVVLLFVGGGTLATLAAEHLFSLSKRELVLVAIGALCGCWPAPGRYSQRLA